MKEVTITKEQFMELCADITMENAKDNLGMILAGGVASCELEKVLFGSDESKTFTEKEFVELCASGVQKITRDEKFEKISTALGLMTLALSGELKHKLFKEEDNK